MDYKKIYQDNIKNRSNLVELLFVKGMDYAKAKEKATELQEMSENLAVTIIKELLEEEETAKNESVDVIIENIEDTNNDKDKNKNKEETEEEN